MIACGFDPNSKLWGPTGVFPAPGVKAPGARMGNISSLAEQMVTWALNGHSAFK